MKIKYKVIILCIISFIIGITIYINPLFIYRNYKLTNHIESISTKDKIESNELIPFDYDKVYVIYPYTAKKDIEKDLGIKSRHIKENNNDNYQTILVIKDNKVISSTKISLTYSFQPLAEYNYFAKRDTIINIYNSEDTTSFIEQKKYYEDTFHDISYTLPGSYWEEDTEESGKLYYLDIDSNNYLSVKKEDKFGLSKYLKTRQVLLKEDMHINTYKAKYIESINLIMSNNSIDITYIIDIKDSTYIFTLNSSKENLAFHKESLYNIMKSIKE